MEKQDSDSHAYKKDDKIEFGKNCTIMYTEVKRTDSDPDR